MRTIARMALALLLLLAGCAREAPKSAKEKVRQLAEHAVSAEQASLWKSVEAGSDSTLQRVGVAERPVEVRKRVSAPYRASTSTPGPLPPGVQTGVRIASAPDLPDGVFSGQARVARAEGERVELDLGQAKTLALFARAAGRPLALKVGDAVSLDYRLREDPYDRRQIIAVRTGHGGGMVSVLEGGHRPVVVQIPLFALVASQVGRADSSFMQVDVRVGGVRRLMRPGQIAEFPGLTVGLLASAAYVGADAYRAEGNPYSIDLIAWSGTPER